MHSSDRKKLVRWMFVMYRIADCGMCSIRQEKLLKVSANALSAALFWEEDDVSSEEQIRAIITEEDLL